MVKIVRARNALVKNSFFPEEREMNCTFCGKKVEVEGGIGRRDLCVHCGRDLRCCKQCKFYDSRAYNECREVMAERIIDKERANACEYFAPRGSTQTNAHRVANARTALEALFKK
ncbi:MAG: hypothetical protein C4582_09670 [Desulfobacteraceae bacterium]|jgi:hypothetical protein|nr:MAG: hypothetical protein C4582_09670 [Desulfobacteraceae bacterium]